jgi:hypothetical protein
MRVPDVLAEVGKLTEPRSVIADEMIISKDAWGK